MADKPKTVKVEVTEAHTALGKSYDVGDEYEVDEAFADALVVQGKAKLAGGKDASHYDKKVMTAKK